MATVRRVRVLKKADNLDQLLVTLRKDQELVAKETRKEEAFREESYKPNAQSIIEEIFAIGKKDDAPKQESPSQTDNGQNLSRVIDSLQVLIDKLNRDGRVGQ